VNRKIIMKILQLALASIIFIIIGLAAASGGAPLQYLAGTDPLYSTAVICAGFIAACFVLGWITGDYSQTDRLWSVAPVIYVWFFAAMAWPDPRLILMASLATLWGARLTFNFARKGGYTSEEDYRWVFLKGKITNPVAWQAFNLAFIAGYQQVLIFLFTLPAYAVYRDGGRPIGRADLIAAAVFLALLALETVADEQMWRFQQEKKRKKAAGETLSGDYGRGYLSSGLYGISRHPNYFGEVFMWWAFYLFVPAGTGMWLHWTVIGAVLLTALFQGSIWFTEYISAGKYPSYRDYQHRVSKFIPWFSRKPVKS
jgi:steroid 5-alpha reductase family enzyme